MDVLAAALRKLVGVEVEDRAARLVAEHHLVPQRRNRRRAEHVHAGDRGARPDTSGSPCANSTSGYVTFGSPRGLDVSTPGRPIPKLPSHTFQPRFAPAGHECHLLDDVLPDVGEEHVAVRRIPGETLRVAHAVGVDLAKRVRCPFRRRTDSTRECRTCRSRCSCSSGSMRKILPKPDDEILREVERIAAASAVGDADVEQTVVRAARASERIERRQAAVVIGERLLEAHDLARRTAVVRGRGRVARRPLVQHGVVRVATAAGLEIRGSLVVS